MKLLVTRSEIPHFYMVEPEFRELQVIDFGHHDLCQSDWSLQRSLPNEITTMIFHHLFLIYIQAFNFDLAGALVSVNKTFANDIYDWIFGRSVLQVATKIKRVCNTLNLIEMIHDSFLTVDRISTYTMCRVIRRKFSGRFYPWNRIYECYATPLNGVISDETPTEQFATGTLNGDNVWLNGSFMNNGMFNCRRLKHPVINLEITNFYDLNLCTSKYLQRDPIMKRFIKLIRHVYGSSACVHIMYNNSSDGNPFDLTATGFIEF